MYTYIQGHGSYPAEYVTVRKADGGRCLPLDPNHTHFFLADDGTVGKRDAEEHFRDDLLHEWLDQNNRQFGMYTVNIFYLITVMIK